MSCRDKDVIAWKSFEIGDGILYTEDDVKKTCPTPSSLHVGFIVTIRSIHPFSMYICVQTYEEYI
jgi:hypothetical protein